MRRRENLKSHKGVWDQEQAGKNNIGA
jgi:hypothetical protein